MKPDELYDVKQTAELLDLSTARVRSLIRAEKLRIAVDYPKIRISGSEIFRYLKTRADTKQEQTWVECKGCEYYRTVNHTPYTFCHYCVDTGQLRGIPAKDCYLHEGTPYKPKERKRKT